MPGLSERPEAGPRGADQRDETFTWSWNGTSLTCAAARMGAGPRALLLPALSSISTLDEMAPLQRRLAGQFEAVAVDWPGFGVGVKPRAAWTPEAMAACLAHVLATVAPDPVLIVAAGHAAGYVLRHFAARPERAPDLVLIAPTWRGPLPTMMGRRPGWLGRVTAAMDMPVLGPVLYALNLSDPVIRMMAKGHVYADPAWLTPGRMAEKRRVARAPGARFASVRFVTGMLDPFASAEAFCTAASAIPAEQLHLIWGEDTPRKSKAEMAALAASLGVAPTVLPRGKLGLHEEFPDAVADAVMRLAAGRGAGAGR